MKILGHHLIVELYECNSTALSDVAKVESIMIAAAKAAKATIVDTVFHHFKPHGVSGVVVIAESHLAVHTWPEHKYVSMDLFTCGSELKPWDAFKVVKKMFRARHSSVMKIERGMVPK